MRLTKCWRLYFDTSNKHIMLAVINLTPQAPEVHGNMMTVQFRVRMRGVWIAVDFWRGLRAGVLRKG